jgi:hypothetical protein
MRNANELDTENTQLNDVSRLDSMQQSVANQIVFLEFAFGQAGCEVGTVNGNVEFFQDVRQRAEMIFMPVRENDGSNVLSIFFEKIEVRNTDINAVSGFFGKAHAGVEDEHLILIAHSHTIHSKLADPAERNDLQNTTHYC